MYYTDIYNKATHFFLLTEYFSKKICFKSLF